MYNPVTERTPLVIAAEINMLTFQTKKILLASAIEIGRRLQEAKALVKHGEWGKWLEESVSYSQKTAERLIKLYEEYGPNLPDESGRSKSTLVSILTYTQALNNIDYNASNQAVHEAAHAIFSLSEYTLLDVYFRRTDELTNEE